jgi:4-amino-4-deoxy-L-arabinose transferase-like glycosyltransferase
MKGATHSGGTAGFGRADALWAAAAAALHLLVGAAYRMGAGIGIDPDRPYAFGDIWHLLPTDLLRDRLAESIWHMHAQPPVYNLWTAFFLRVFPTDPHGAIHTAKMALGAGIAALTFVVLRAALRRRAPAGVVALALALNPALVLYEAALGYDLLSAFWVAGAAGCVAAWQQTRRPGWLIAAVALLNALALTRSLFHIAALLAAVVLLAVAARRWRMVLAAGLVVSLATAGWYAKNAAQYGFFGASSWGGMSLWAAVSANYDRTDLERLHEAGVVEAFVLAVTVWQPPSRYAPLGYEAEGSAPATDRDNLHNVNVVTYAPRYGRNALRLIAARPLHYLANVARAYRIYAGPASGLDSLDINADRMAGHRRFWTHVIEGRLLTRPFARFFSGKDPFRSLWFFVLPLVWGGYMTAVARRCGRRPRRWRAALRRDPTMLFCALLIAWVTAVGITLEYGENERFRFLIEPVLWPFTVAVIWRAIAARRRRRAR